MYYSTSRLAIFFAAIFLIGIFLDAARADSIVRFTYDGALQGGYDVQVYSGLPTAVTTINFLRYVNRGLYDNTIIHHGDYNSILKGGGYKLDNPDNYEAIPTHAALSEVPAFDPVINEPGLSNLRRTIAMEKEAGLPDSATSRWYINLADNTGRDTQNGGYTVFGKVLGDDGMAFVDQMDHTNPRIWQIAIDEYYPQYPELTSVPLYITDDDHYFFITLSSAAIVPGVWKGGNSSIDWGNSANWDGVYKENTCVPDGAGSRIELNNKTAPISTLDMALAGRTVGTITFDGSGTEIASSGQHALTLDNIDQPAVINVKGTHTISASVVLAGDANITGAGTLTLSGGVSGAYALNVAGGTLNATSIQVDSLTISEPVIPTVAWKGGAATDPTDWSLAANWITTGDAPSGAGCQVAFGNQPSENNTVDLKTAGQIVGYMSFAASTSTTIMSSGQHTLTLDNQGQAAEIIVAGTHAISVPVVLASDADISGAGTLTLSGGISGPHALTFTGDVLNASSIQVDTLNIGSINPSAAAVPEPSTLALFSIGFAGLLAFGWRRKMKR